MEKILEELINSLTNNQFLEFYFNFFKIKQGYPFAFFFFCKMILCKINRSGGKC